MTGRERVGIRGGDDMISGARSRGNRALAAVTVAGALLVAVWGVPRVGLGQKADAAEPEIDLLKTAPFDRLTPLVTCLADEVGSQLTLARAVAYCATPAHEIPSAPASSGADLIVSSLGPNGAEGRAFPVTIELL